MKGEPALAPTAFHNDGARLSQVFLDLGTTILLLDEIIHRCLRMKIDSGNPSTNRLFCFIVFVNSSRRQARQNKRLR